MSRAAKLVLAIVLMATGIGFFARGAYIRGRGGPGLISAAAVRRSRVLGLVSLAAGIGLLVLARRGR